MDVHHVLYFYLFEGERIEFHIAMFNETGNDIQGWLLMGDYTVNEKLGLTLRYSEKKLAQPTMRSSPLLRTMPFPMNCLVCLSTVPRIPLPQQVKKTSLGSGFFIDSKVGAFLSNLFFLLV